MRSVAQPHQPTLTPRTIAARLGGPNGTSGSSSTMWCATIRNGKYGSHTKPYRASAKVEPARGMSFSIGAA